MSDAVPVSNPDFDALTDAQLQHHEARVDVQRRGGSAFVPGFPLTLLKAVVAEGAEKALPLILSMHRQQTMTGKEWAPLTSAVWRAAGDPSPKQRASIMRQLKKLPDVIRVELKKTAMGHYRVARGVLWGGAKKSD